VSQDLAFQAFPDEQASELIWVQLLQAVPLSDCQRPRFERRCISSGKSSRLARGGAPDARTADWLCLAGPANSYSDWPSKSLCT